LALFEEAKIEKENITSYEIGHIIAPRLNAMGRLEHAMDSLRLLCTKDTEKAKRLANLVGETNNKRKLLTQEAVEEAKLLVDKSAKIHVLASINWNPGIIGLVAGRICEETGKPVIAMSIGEEFSKGSARANNTTNIVEVIRSCEDILVAVGGHEGAAGFTITTKNLKIFKKRLEMSMDKEAILEEPVLEIEAEVNLENLTLSLAKSLQDFEPFGINNPKPILTTSNMKISDLRTVGDNKHLKFKADGFDAIAFGMGELIKVLEEGQLINMAYCLEIDKWDGREKLQLKIKDMI